MELTCPSCGARYRVPDGAIGERGRPVSCSNCGHGWRAVPPEAGAGAAVQQAGGGGVATAEVDRLRPQDPTRVAQLAELRDMIADVQAEDGAPAAQTRDHRQGRVHVEFAEPPDAQGVAAAAAGIGRARTDVRRIDDVGDGGEPLPEDPLRRRMAEHDARAMRERQERDRLRRSMKKGEGGAGRGAGAFLAGFLLVVLVAGAMLAAYLLHPEIIARVPASEPWLTAYVAAVDDLRVAIAEGYEQARAWVMDAVADTA